MLHLKDSLIWWLKLQRHPIVNAMAKEVNNFVEKKNNHNEDNTGGKSVDRKMFRHDQGSMLTQT